MTKEELQRIIAIDEGFRIELTTSTGNMDKFQEAICAFVLTKCLAPCEHVSDDSTSYSKQIPEGSVIFAKNGAASMSNKKRLTKIRCCIDMNTMAVFPKNDLILPDFLFATIEAMDVSSHVRQGAIPSISPKSIEDSYIAMPTKEEQYRYISMTKQADKSGFQLRKSIDAIDAVIKSLINS